MGTSVLNAGDMWMLDAHGAYSWGQELANFEFVQYVCAAAVSVAATRSSGERLSM
jgi:hypothetical protein